MKMHTSMLKKEIAQSCAGATDSESQSGVEPSMSAICLAASATESSVWSLETPLMEKHQSTSVQNTPQHLPGGRTMATESDTPLTKPTH